MKIPFKICGLTREEDVLFAERAGASFLGFVMVPGTPRCLTRERARALMAMSRLPKVLVVGNLGITETQSLIDELRPECVQLHRNEPPGYAQSLHGARIWRAFSLRTMSDVEAASIYPAEVIVADGGQGGGGQVCDWAMARCLSRRKPVILAGGLTALNVRAGYESSGAFAVDCSSGVEISPGVKDSGKLMEFALACKESNTFNL
ncbi:MAG: phosphoribosylanthranilate isomerase [Victivallales bacterium]|nr:phosphoribosylanthranilate isomerase [Victivallales bacterium]